MIGIIGAMEEEVAELKKDMQIDETIEQAGVGFCQGSFGGIFIWYSAKVHWAAKMLLL